MMRFRWTALAAVVAFAGCSKDDAGEERAQSEVAVRTEVAAIRPFIETVGALGFVAARPGHVAALSAPIAARVTRVIATVGRRVESGDELVELDQGPLVAAARSADAALTSAERSAERTRRLADAGIAPRKDLDQATADLERARADAATARRQQELSVVRAPFAGVVTRVQATLGATADPSQMLVEVADPGAVDILFSVAPSQAGLLHRGARISISAGQNAAGDPLGSATVIDVGGVVDTSSRGVTVRAQAPGASRQLRIGETVFGEIAAVVKPNAVVVPLEALVPDGEAFKVFVVDAAGMARARAVTVGGRTDKLAEISAGLKAGERVVTYGAYGIEDSAKVTSVTPPPAKP
jgi:RND family efflux transporter MFP subunit